VHEMDIALWGLNRSSGRRRCCRRAEKFVWRTNQETPNTELAVFNFGEVEMTFEVRNLPSPTENLAPLSRIMWAPFLGTRAS